MIGLVGICFFCLPSATSKNAVQKKSIDCSGGEFTQQMAGPAALRLFESIEVKVLQDKGTLKLTMEDIFFSLKTKEIR